MTARIRVLILVLVLVGVAAVGLYRTSFVEEAAQKPHPAFANAPSPLATPPPGAEPGAWWTDTLRQADHDGSLYLLLGIVLVAALLNVVSPSEAPRLRASVLCFLGYLVTVPVAGFLISKDSLSAYGQVRFIARLLMGIAVVNLLTILVLEIGLKLLKIRIPKILSDVILAGSYVTLGLGLLTRAGFNVSSLLATSAVLTAVIGLSIQDTLGNIMAGLVLELEDTINVGDWVKVGDVTGRVVEIRWRQTKIETRNWETVVIPNSTLMKAQFLILGRRQHRPIYWRRWIWFSVELSVPPSRVIEAVNLALQGSPLERVAPDPKPHAILMDFREGTCVYAARYWLTDLAVDDPTDSAVRERIYLGLRRADIRLAFPSHKISMQEENEEARTVRARKEHDQRLEALRRVDIFKILDPPELEELAPRLRHAPFAPGEVMTKQGATAHWLYLIISGKATVHVNQDGIERQVAQLQDGEFFGEMALLTGAPRSATVVAATPVECWRLDREGFETIIQHRPELAKKLSHILALRKTALTAAQEDMKKDARPSVQAVEQDILSRITSFFGLSDVDPTSRPDFGTSTLPR